LPAAGVLLGFAVLAKGLVPLALAAPLAPVAWWARRGAGETACPTGPALVGQAVPPARVIFRAGVPFLVICLPWYWLCFLRNGPVFLKQFFVVHHFGRITSGALMHGQHWWYYLPVFAAAFLPWTPLLFLPARRGAWHDPRRVLLAAWVLFGLLMFSVAVNKLPGYVLPLLPAAALLAAVALDEAAGAQPWLAACALLLVAFPVAAQVLAAALTSGLLRAPRAAFHWIWLAPVAVAAAAWAWESHRRRLAAVVTIAVGAAAGVLYVKRAALPQVEQMAAARALWREISPRAGDVCIDKIERDWRYGLNYYSIAPLPECAAQPKALRVIQIDPGQPPRLAPSAERPVDPASSSVVPSPYRK